MAKCKAPGKLASDSLEGATTVSVTGTVTGAVPSLGEMTISLVYVPTGKAEATGLYTLTISEKGVLMYPPLDAFSQPPPDPA